jgi:hypothetical protein
MSIRIKNKLAKRRVYGVGLLVGYDRRGNLRTDKLFPRYFFVYM